MIRKVKRTSRAMAIRKQKVRNEISATWNGLALVTSGNVEVDTSHEFRTDRPDAATPLVQGTLAQALDYLATEWRDDVVRIALNGRDCYLLVPATKDFFELPPVDTPIDFDVGYLPLPSHPSYDRIGRDWHQQPIDVISIKSRHGRIGIHAF